MQYYIIQLNLPNKTTFSEHICSNFHKMHYRSGHFEFIGKRKTMEDVTVILDNIPTEKYQYFAIFDGHCGSDASNYASVHIHESFKKHFNETPDSDILESLDSAVQEINAILIQRYKNQGCVVGIVVISDESIYSYNIGDVRAIIVYPDGKVERISHDHRASDPEEKLIIESLGGKVINKRLMGIFEISRSLGDGGFSDFICTRPFTSVLKRIDGSKIILACDGVWDVVNEKTAAKIAQKNMDPNDAAMEIVDCAIKNRSKDNISCVVIDLTHS